MRVAASSSVVPLSASRSAWRPLAISSERACSVRYPLRGFVTYKEIELAVEKTSEGYLEVHAPDGQNFSPDTLRTMVCDGMAELRERLSVNDLEACSEECGL
jgi:hypothetical protein